MPFIIAFSRKGMTFRTFTCETQTWWVQSYPSPSPSKPPSVRPSTTRQRNFAPQRTINVMRAAPKIKESGHHGKWWTIYLFDIYAYIYIWSLSGQGSVLFSDGYVLIMSLPFRSTHDIGIQPWPYNPVQNFLRSSSRVSFRNRQAGCNIRHHGTTTCAKGSFKTDHLSTWNMSTNLPCTKKPALHENMRPYPTEKNKPSISSSKLSWEEGIEYFTTCLNWFCVWECLRGVLR